MNTIAKQKIMNDNGFKNCNPENNRFCEFLADDGEKRKWVYFASVLGLDWPENRHCHTVLQLYYDTHYAMDIPFATKKDAWDYVDSKGKIDKRIINKESSSQGWQLTLKGVAS